MAVGRSIILGMALVLILVMFAIVAGILWEQDEKTAEMRRDIITLYMSLPR